MLVAVASIWVMCMVVRHGLVVMGMHMRLGSINPQLMFMHVVPVVVLCVHVHVRGRVAVRGVLVQVAVVFGQVQPHTPAHQRANQPLLPADRFSKKHHRHHGTYKRRCRKISTRA